MTMSDLTINKHLLNHKFNGYKLAPTMPDVNQMSLITPVDVPSRNPNEYSYVYTRCYEMHNHLYVDTFNSMVYFVDKDLKVNTLILTEEGEASASYHAFTIPRTERSFIPFTCTMTFPSETLAVVCDGGGSIYLVETGERTRDTFQKWKCAEDRVLHDFNSSAYVVYANIEENKNALHVLVLTLQEIINKDDGAAKMHVVFNWLQVQLNFENHSESLVKGMKRFMGEDLPNAFWLTEDYTHFLVAASKKFSMVDEEFLEIEPQISVNGMNGHANGETKLYSWTQSKELLSISFDFCVTENEVECEIKHNLVSVKLKNGRCLLEGALQKEVIVDASRWYVEKNRLEVVLIKKAAGEFWTVVVPGDCHGNHIIEGEEEVRVQELGEQLQHLTSENGAMEDEKASFNMAQLEECDEELEQDVKLYSIDVFTGHIENAKNLSGHRWLFTNSVDNTSPPLICLRHNVDGIIWQADKCHFQQWQHKFTLDAFGFVHASKRECKFSSCTPNFKFSFITDCTSHVYIYESDERNPSQHNQYIVSVRDCDRILGCQATNEYLYVLTDKHLNLITLP